MWHGDNRIEPVTSLRLHILRPGAVLSAGPIIMNIISVQKHWIIQSLFPVWNVRSIFFAFNSFVLRCVRQCRVSLLRYRCCTGVRSIFMYSCSLAIFDLLFVGHVVAIKCVRREALNNPKLISNLKSEIQIGLTYRHPRLVQLYDCIVRCYYRTSAIFQCSVWDWKKSLCRGHKPFWKLLWCFKNQDTEGGK